MGKDVQCVSLAPSGLSCTKVANSTPTDSDILHIEVPGTSIVVLNSLKAARDLLEKRSALYSSRWD